MHTICVSLIGASLASVASAGTVLASIEDRDTYISNAIAWFADSESQISAKDMFNGPKNPLNLKTFQTLDCDFVEPDAADPIGGTTPKFYCEFPYNGEQVQVKIKYDQQYNSAWDWGRGNPEVYSSVISQRVLWATGFGSDQSVPITVNCRNCPIEPWTYIQAIQGYDSEDVLSGWMDMSLINSGNWKNKVEMITFNASIAYFKLNEYLGGDKIEYIDAENIRRGGYFWPEMYDLPTTNNEQSVARDALSVIAAFLSYCDNFDGNQGFICLDEVLKNEVGKEKSECKGTPLLYIHDVGGTLGYGWSLKHKNFWPNYVDLAQWLEVETWGNVRKCEVQVNGIPGCSWSGNLKVTEEGRAMAARLMAKLTDNQISDLFKAARVNLMRNESVEDWINGFKSKLQQQLISTVCPDRDSVV